MEAEHPTEAAGLSELHQLIHARIENLRPKLLDLSRRNPLISTRLGGRSNSYLRAVDELPDVLFFGLSRQERFQFQPLPPLEEDPKDERSENFLRALSEALLIDEEYTADIEAIDQADDDAAGMARNAERRLRDRLRARLGMAARQTRAELSLAQHAKNNGISPSYELPSPEDEHHDGRHRDQAIQTLLLPDDLERTANRLLSKARSWQQETGLNVMYAAFGFLEWSDPTNEERSLSPLVLVPITLSKTSTSQGPRFWIEGSGESGEMNTVLREKLRRDFGIEVPEYEGGSVEDYIADIEKVEPETLAWRVRRFAAFGVFPSAQLAMYHDLDTRRHGFKTNDVVNELVGGNASTGTATPFAEEYPVDEPAIEAKVPLVVTDADSSQFSTIVDVADGKNLAVEGPPGTGKSQTIINTIAAALAAGKKVLFVAEKTAALEVVRARLESMGLGEFILPLQATRSSRQQVASSVRERFELKRAAAPPDYEREIKRFKAARTEIARYVDLVSLKYGSTGLTIHQILGRSILTADHLEGTPRPFQVLDVQNVETIDQHQIEEIKAAAKALEEANGQAAGAAAHWRGLRLGPLDRFTVDDLLEQAGNAARLYGEAQSARANLAPIGVPDDASPDSIWRLRDALVALSSPLADEDLALVDALVRGNKVDAFKSFLNECESFRGQRETLVAAVKEPFDETLASDLRKMRHVCQAAGFDTLDVNVLRQRRGALAESISAGDAVEKELADFLTLAPELAHLRLETLAEAHRIVDTTSQAVLAMRNRATAAPKAAPVIERGIAMGQSLKKRREELAHDLAVERLPAALTISQWGSALRSAGAFRFFSSGYRAAKRAYKALLRVGRYRRERAIQRIGELAEWKAAEERFAADEELSAVFGAYFDGLDTDFERFGQLLNYYLLAKKRFAGSAHRPLREFLMAVDLDSLLSIPVASAGLELDYAELVEELERRRAELARIDTGLPLLAELANRVRDAGSTKPDDLVELAALSKSYSSKRITIEENSIAALLGTRFVGVETRAQPFAEALAAAAAVVEHRDWTQVLLVLMSDHQVDEALRRVEAFARARGAAEAAVEALSGRTGIPLGNLIPNGSLDAIAARLRAASSDRLGIILHATVFAAEQNVGALGFSNHIKELAANDGGYRDLPDKLDAAIARAMAMRVFGDYSATLTRFSGEKLSRLRTQLATADARIIELSREQLRHKLIMDAKPPAGIGTGRKSEWTETALLLNEINKQKRHYPVRDVVHRAGRALVELKPCWMMSPLSIAQYLAAGTVRFDLCIIDEASQMPPENAIGALLRATKAMIVGDTNQLPPTSFFRKMIAEEDDDEDEVVLNESILEMANATFRPPRRLRWHYRSRNSSLISFSNRMVYDDDLIVFPSANENQKGMGVSLVPVPGLYKAGTNAAEAKAVVEAALRFMHHDPERSLGIVTLNQKQRDLIQDEMDHALASDPTAAKYVERWTSHRDGLESLFIKNLENVQGDERDVIFIDTVYGPESAGTKVHQRFGPINGIAGKRRLNVLFSRAKEQIVTFSSMTSGDITADGDRNPGVYMLKRWLEYAATGVLEFRRGDAERAGF